MITLEKIPFTSVAGQPLTLYLWQTDAPCRGVIQLVHGMAEHIARYDRLARALCAAGYTVAGHSHLGHGEDALRCRKGYMRCASCSMPSATIRRTRALMRSKS